MQILHLIIIVNKGLPLGCVLRWLNLQKLPKIYNIFLDLSENLTKTIFSDLVGRHCLWHLYMYLNLWDDQNLSISRDDNCIKAFETSRWEPNGKYQKNHEKIRKDNFNQKFLVYCYTLLFFMTKWSNSWALKFYSTQSIWKACINIFFIVILASNCST